MKTEIPTELKIRQPNEKTIAAMNELIQGKGHKAESVDALFSELTDGKIKNMRSLVKK